MHALQLSVAALVASAAFTGPLAAQTRDQISIVGSSTVFPYTQAVVERFGTATEFPSPVLESTGTGGGMQIFCEGVGAEFPDITGASRAMADSEYELCMQNGVESITEVQIGSDGLSLAISRDGEAFDLSKAEIFQALAAEVPVDGEIVPNPHTMWSDIDPSLPETEIEVFGPPPTSGTRDAFVELVMLEGCQEFEAIQALDEAAMEETCSRMRQDGLYIESGENDNLIVQRLQQSPEAVGIFGYSFLYENMDTLQPITVGGVEPTPETIGDGSYGISRPLFFYVKNAHRQAIPGLNEFVAEYVSEEAMGDDGYLVERGLVPLSPERREEIRTAATEGVHMDRYAE